MYGFFSFTACCISLHLKRSMGDCSREAVETAGPLSAVSVTYDFAVDTPGCHSCIQSSSVFSHGVHQSCTWHNIIECMCVKHSTIKGSFALTSEGSLRNSKPPVTGYGRRPRDGVMTSQCMKLVLVSFIQLHVHNSIVIARGTCAS